MKLTWQCMFSPRLYKIYKDGPRDSLYQPEGIEKWSDKVITMANTILNIGLYTSPFICFYIYKRGFFSLDETRTIIRYVGGLSCLIALSYILRGIGRASNPKYVDFLKALTSPVTDQKVYLDALRKYDFDFQAWPATYTLPPKKSSTWLEKHPFSSCANGDLPLYKRMTVQVLAYIATHTFALRLIYPGSLGLVHNLLRSALFQGRTQLVEVFDGQRTKLKTADGNEIDTMFVDNRAQSPKGKILVICCEGNSGFYEIGIMTTPVKAGYSALGWNHPGFAGSTGLPYPEQEHNAIDAVMRYAINELGFEPQQIVMYGWSIGGYVATWAAVNYPEVKALVLDATFDDLLPLAQNQMPSSWSLLVKEVVRSHVDLNIKELIAQYGGPVQLVRRTEDEIICLRQGQLASNRGNFLLTRLVEARHPELPASALESLQKHVALLDSQRAAMERTELDDNAKAPLKLISKYMRDYRSSHCTPLPEDHFDAILTNLTAKY
ncbi:phosphatidylserine lipase ABHD16A [Choristoneura fumiferana]|uniref:phosphatidylserine lipase ABHD16A n=1 Tax=Choristoneura fumiferana TaxID=7141 RepID=UPI003D1576E1